MKKAALRFISAMVLSVVLWGCNSNSPKSVADKFVNNVVHMKYDDAEASATESTKDILHTLKQFASTKPDSVLQSAKKITVTIIDVQESGDKAVVTFTTSKDKAEKKLNLVKKDEKWLVHLTKDDSIVNEYANDSPTPEDAVEAEDNKADSTK